MNNTIAVSGAAFQQMQHQNRH